MVLFDSSQAWMTSAFFYKQKLCENFDEGCQVFCNRSLRLQKFLADSTSQVKLGKRAWERIGIWCALMIHGRHAEAWAHSHYSIWHKSHFLSSARRLTKDSWAIKNVSPARNSLGSGRHPGEKCEKKCRGEQRGREFVNRKSGRRPEFGEEKEDTNKSMTTRCSSHVTPGFPRTGRADEWETEIRISVFAPFPEFQFSSHSFIGSEVFSDRDLNVSAASHGLKGPELEILRPEKRYNFRLDTSFELSVSFKSFIRFCISCMIHSDS